MQWDKCKGKLPKELSLFLLMVINTIFFYKLLTIKHIKWRQWLNEDVFEASALCFFIVSFKRCYDEYLLWFFLHFLLKFKPFDEFFPFQNVIASLSECVATVCVCVYIHWIKTSLKVSPAIFLSAFYKRWYDGSLWGLSSLYVEV